MRKRCPQLLRTNICLIGSCIILFLGDSIANRKTEAMVSEEQVQECSVTLGDGYESEVVWRTTDMEVIEQQVLEPLSKMVDDRNPFDYELVGTLTLKYEDRERYLSLFLPWGHVKEDGAYRVANLGKLKEQIVERLNELAEEVEGWRVAGDGGEPQP